MMVKKRLDIFKVELISNEIHLVQFVIFSSLCGFKRFLCLEVNSWIAKMILNHNSTRIFHAVSWELLWVELDLGG